VQGSPCFEYLSPLFLNCNYSAPLFEKEELGEIILINPLNPAFSKGEAKSYLKRVLPMRPYALNKSQLSK
jgi:hypothetical protein